MNTNATVTESLQYDPHRHDGQSVILASECEEQIAEAQRDMLAKCITAVEQLTFYSGDDKEQVLALLQLQVKSLQ